MVTRSALVLKLLTSAKHGSLLAAPTFGLPEEVGGVRNWDYRYTWLRDASFTVYALSRLGFVDEGQHFVQWIKDRLHWNDANGPLDVMYRLDGSDDLAETQLDHWEDIETPGQFVSAMGLPSSYSSISMANFWTRSISGASMATRPRMKAGRR